MRGSAALVLALLLTPGAAPAGAVEVRSDPDLTLHLFGVTGLGYALKDLDITSDVAADAAEAKRLASPPSCDDKSRASFAREPAAADAVDREEELRLKFGCMTKAALGFHKGRRGGPQRLRFVLVFNGGLNKQSDSTAVARDHYRGVWKSGAYPVFMIWPTGFRQSYGNAVFETRDAEYVDPTKPENFLTAFSQTLSDLATGVSVFPKNIESDARFFAKDYGNDSVATTAARWRTAAGEIADAKGEDTRNVYFSPVVDQPGRRNFLTAALIPIRPVTLTLAQVGTTAWNNMVRRTRTTVHNVDEFVAAPPADVRLRDPSCARDIQNDGPKLRRCFPKGAGAFSRFFHWFAACAKPDSAPAGSDVCPLPNMPESDRRILREARLTLIGHSMGAIVINELVTAYPNLPYDNVVFMAGADSVRSTYRTVVPLVERNAGCTKFFNLMLHPFNDANETTAAGAAPRGSLLEYIDHYLASPKTVDDRTVGKWANVAATKHLFGVKGQKWMLFHIFDKAADGKLAPLTHGGFNDKDVPFYTRAFWGPTDVTFRTPSEKECDKRFFAASR